MLYTPGPWYRNIKPATTYNTIFAGRNTHVTHLETHGLSPEEVEANCALITAAPDLLEALNYIRRTTGFANLSDVGARRTIAAIDKAEGRA